MNIYVGIPEHFGDVLIEAQSKALEIQVRQAVAHLTNSQGGKYEAVVRLLNSLIGEDA